MVLIISTFFHRKNVHIYIFSIYNSQSRRENRFKIKLNVLKNYYINIDIIGVHGII